MQKLTVYLMEHRGWALLFTFALAVLPTFGAFGAPFAVIGAITGAVSILFAALVTLRRGALEGLLFTLIASLPVVAFYFIGYGSPNAGDAQNVVLISPIVTVTGLFISNILTWLFAIALRQHGITKLLQWATLLAMLVVSTVHLIYPSVDKWWEAQLLSYFNQQAKLMGKSMAWGPAAPIEMANALKYYATSLVLIVLIYVYAIAQVLVARWWETVVFKVGGFRRELLSIRLNRLFGAFFIGGMLLTYWGNLVALDMMPLLYCLFFCAGLSLLHFMLAFLKTGSWFWFVMVYIAIGVFFPASVAMIALVALFDVWFDFRGRMSKSV